MSSRLEIPVAIGWLVLCGGIACDGSARPPSGGVEASDDSKADGTGSERGPRFLLVNTIHAGETVEVFAEGGFSWRALELFADAGDSIEVTVRSSEGIPDVRLREQSGGWLGIAHGEPVAAGETSSVSLSANIGSSGRHFLLFRERRGRPAHLSVQLTGGRPLRALDEWEELFARKFGARTVPLDWDPATGGYECVAAASAYQRARDGAAFDAVYRADMLLTVRSIADTIAAKAARWVAPART
jgi:hypothetical protein